MLRREEKTDQDKVDPMKMDSLAAKHIPKPIHSRHKKMEAGQADSRDIRAANE